MPGKKIAKHLAIQIMDELQKYNVPVSTIIWISDFVADALKYRDNIARKKKRDKERYDKKGQLPLDFSSQ